LRLPPAQQRIGRRKIVNAKWTAAFFVAISLSVVPVAAKEKQAATSPSPSPSSTRPKLIVAISVDQFSSDLFRLYRNDFTGGFKRLTRGVVFPIGYQAQAATETCPGHSTILTGSWPWRSGIIANNWFNMAAERPDKKVYCAEDETVPGSSSENYTVSPVHLKVPTLGDMVKQSGGRSVAVSGKDRAAVMMGGKDTDEIWWWGSRSYVSYKGKPEPATVTALNSQIDTMLETPIAPAPAQARCKALVNPIVLSPEKTVGGERMPIEAGDAKAFRATTALDETTLNLAAGLVDEMQLGSKAATDVLAISLSATDYIGHSFGPLGPEMCDHLLVLDAALEKFFVKLDEKNMDYVVVLTADHGGLDIPERTNAGGAARISAELTPGKLDQQIAADLNVTGFLLSAVDPTGDYYVAKDMASATQQQIIEALRVRMAKSGQLESVFSKAEIERTPRPKTPASEWTLIERVAMNYFPERSGDAYVILKPNITPIADVSGYVATHGSVWDYDRRVPIMFWRKGLSSGERTDPIATVDILPTLASLIGLDIAPATIDGKCVNLQTSETNNCRK
jgi:predicted AlkP superfamily pyrophosphatase or phosphodiesterase